MMDGREAKAVHRTNIGSTLSTCARDRAITIDA